MKKLTLVNAFFAQVSQHFGMLYHCQCKVLLRIVGQAVLFGRFFHNSRNALVVYVADVWKQVMLNLVVQATNKPRENLTLR